MAKQSTTTKPKTSTHIQMGKAYINLHGKKTLYARSQWYRYEAGVWSPLPEFEIEKEVWALLEKYEIHGLKPTNPMRNSVQAYIRAFLSRSEDELDAYPNLINLRNGIYNLDTDKFIDHNAALLLTSQLPFDYDPAATCKMFDLYAQTTFVKRDGVTPDDELIYFMQEAIGYSLTTDISHQIMFWCIGEGENGKGVFFHILSQLGGDSATYIDFNILGRERYQLATLAGKRIIMCAEADNGKVVADGIIKTITGGDPIPVRQINEKGFTLICVAKLYWSMNRLPVILDTSHGFWRRFRAIPFNKLFDDSNRIPDLKDRLDLELSGIFNWCLIGMRRLRKNKRFSYCSQIEIMGGQLQTESNTIRLFIEDCCTVDASGTLPDDQSKVPAAELYAAYKIWAKTNGYKPMSNGDFKTEIEALRYYQKRETKGLFYLGLGINSGGTYHQSQFAPKSP